MKRLIYLCFGFSILMYGCAKDKVKNVIPSNNCSQLDSITYTNDVQIILNSNCLPCHQYPGAGGINLDSYNESKNVALSGQLLQSVIHDTNYVIMPPPPVKSLDSCEVKIIKRWLAQGCKE